MSNSLTFNEQLGQTQTLRLNLGWVTIKRKRHFRSPRLVQCWTLMVTDHNKFITAAVHAQDLRG